MTSILTNSGAIVALQTLRSTNESLGMAQREISTGKRINSAADGSAIWAVAKTMETDRDSFKTIQQGLNVATKVVSTAVENANGIVDDLNVIKQRLVASAKSDQDVAKNWDEIKELIDGVKAKISGSQINGVNLLNKQGTGDGATGEEIGKYTVLASLDRSYGNVQTSHTSITVESQDLQTAIADVLDNWTDPSNAKQASALISGSNKPAFADYTTDYATFNDANTSAEDKNALITKYGGTVGVAASTGAAVAGYLNTFSGTVNSALTDGTALTGAALTTADLKDPAGTSISAADYAADHAKYQAILAKSPSDLTASDISEHESLGVKYGGTVDAQGAAATPAGTAVAAVPEEVPAELAAATVLDEDGYAAEAGIPANQSVEALIDVATKAAAKLGAKQHRIESQEKSVGLIKDNLTAGIGALVDTNLEEASARLKALQTQQQLGIQSLSIANQAPGAVLALFR